MKYGKGKGVASKENPQLRTYLSAICKHFDWDAVEANLIIYQPRNQDITEKDYDQWKIESNTIRNWNAKLNRLERHPFEYYAEKERNLKKSTEITVTTAPENSTVKRIGKTSTSTG